MGEVAILASSAETRRGLQRYLTEGGLIPRGASSVDACMAAGVLEGPFLSAAAFVVFPDDFPGREIRGFLVAIAARRPKVLALVVTSRPDRFVDLACAETFRVVARPAWGWAILDAIRAHLAPEGLSRSEAKRVR